MDHKITTLGRQFGSGGREIAKKLAVSLGIPCYDQELIILAAKQAQFNEEIFADKDEKAASPWLYVGVYERGFTPKHSQPAEDILFQMQSEIIRKDRRPRGLYHRGALRRCSTAIRGRGTDEYIYLRTL